VASAEWLELKTEDFARVRAIGLMVWMELSAMIVFLGAAWNAEGAARTQEFRRGPHTVHE
jgi:uncharacterized BrkB/YihY/UPF0761 family membrane protein